MRTSRPSFIPVLLAVTAAATTAGAAAGQAAPPSGAVAAVQPGAWRALFDGTSLDAWRGYQNAEIPAGWKVVDGLLRKDATTRDLMTKEQFGDFELEFEWKLGAGGNAGVFYRATEEYPRIYWSGPEYQLLDDANAPDGRNRLTSAGAAYGLYPAPAGIVKPADEWNASRIVAKGAHVEHWLNGRKLLEYDLWSADWEAKVKPGKFSAWPNYGRAKRGHLGIQGDHNGPLALRNIRIRELP
ncbi:MAG TPA: DUF1080 domain-containing protein [Gemmatimonadaceae bacterium]|nr:DUF1080 domain-containing protein [Gemmatimonadaceae bacterium]